MFDESNLKELREVFRARMKERDFCIGEEQVEDLFRELLNEPILIEPYYERTGPPITPQELVDGFEEVFTQERIAQLFDRPDSFYKLDKK